MAVRCSQLCWYVCLVLNALDSQVVEGNSLINCYFKFVGSNPTLTLIAQLVEQQTVNLRVAGSTPAQKTAERHQGESHI